MAKTLWGMSEAFSFKTQTIIKDKKNSSNWPHRTDDSWAIINRSI